MNYRTTIVLQVFTPLLLCVLCLADIRFSLPLLAYLSAVPLWRAWRRDRLRQYRREHCLCLKYGYNLTGNVSGVCPECGDTIAEQVEDLSDAARRG